MSSIAPNWLPSLEELTLRTDSGAPNPSWFACIFEHTWPTLTAVDIQRCYSVVDFQIVISHTPNLSRLSLRECTFSLEISTLATYTPRLKDLSLGNRLTIDLDSLQHQQHQYRLTALKSLRISHDHDVESDASIPLNAVQFVTRATPGLEYICISDFRGIPASDSGSGCAMVNPAVRELRLYAVSYDPEPHNVLDMYTVISIFQPAWVHY
ncbi:hypothetical protein GQ42DRAFT_179276 [Ramicandelaber brevisporus]|nr:hypothetical protein GQ42DRAFT_179276 [Ramicandelaber brevisporus]